ncbi:MAG: hypothetical protein ACRDIX_04895 [Actinomycetota bacterium]
MGDYTFLIALVFGWLVCSFISGAIWSSKGGTFGTGFLFGLLGLLGILLAAIMKPGASLTTENMKRKCPHCLQEIPAAASVCAFCQRESEPWTFHGGYWWVKRDGRWLYLDRQRGEWLPQPGSESPA